MSERKLKFDVVVAGGGSAGVAAAVGAANAGMRTLLIEKNPYLGGSATHSSVLTFCGFFTQSDPYEQIVGGVGEKVLEELRQLHMYREPYRNPRSGNVIVLLDAEATKYALDQVVLASGASPLLHCQVIGAIVEDGAIRAIECYDHTGRFLVEASAFVDASGEADLSVLAGGQVRFGDEEGQVQASTLVMRIGGVAPHADLTRNGFTEVIQQAKRSGETSLTKEKGMVLRLPGSQDVLAMFADEYVNGLDSTSLTEAEMSARRQAWSYLRVFQRYIPGFENAYLGQTGPAIGVRETRHVVGESTLLGEDILNGVRRPDAVARGGWPVEIHEKGAPAVYRHIRDRSYYDIPLQALKVAGIRNLWCAGRIISCDPVAFASSRVIGTSFATGHAAGVAAAQFAGKGVSDAQAVRKELIRQEALI
jgi:hypothetical protein